LTEVSSDTRLVPDATAAPTGLRTSEMTPLLAEYNGTFLEYAAVVFDSKPERRPAIGKNGKAFGSIEACEAIPMSAANTRWLLACCYGLTTADAMLYQADQGEYVYGEKRDLGGVSGKGKVRGGVNVAADKSRPGSYVTQFIALVQGGLR
jgi:hypothetical protein